MPTEWTDAEYELLSAYIDEQLDDSERTAQRPQADHGHRRGLLKENRNVPAVKLFRPPPGTVLPHSLAEFRQAPQHRA